MLLCGKISRFETLFYRISSSLIKRSIPLPETHLPPLSGFQGGWRSPSYEKKLDLVGALTVTALRFRSLLDKPLSVGHPPREGGGGEIKGHLSSLRNTVSLLVYQLFRLLCFACLFCLWPPVERRADVAALFRVASGEMPLNRFWDVFYSGFPHKILIWTDRRVIILTTKTCPILDTAKRTGSWTKVFGRCPQKHTLKNLKSAKGAWKQTGLFMKASKTKI